MDLAPRVRFTALERVDLSGDRSRGRAGVEAFGGLRELAVSDNGIAEFGPLGVRGATERPDWAASGLRTVYADHVADVHFDGCKEAAE